MSISKTMRSIAAFFIIAFLCASVMAADLSKSVNVQVTAAQVDEKVFRLTCRIENVGDSQIRVAVPEGDIAWTIDGEKFLAGGETGGQFGNERNFVVLDKANKLADRDEVKISRTSALTIEIERKLSVPEDVRVCEIKGHIFVQPADAISNKTTQSTGIRIDREAPIVRMKKVK